MATAPSTESGTTSGGTVVERTFVPHAPYFALGLLFADLYVLKPQVFAGSTILWDIAGFVGWVALVALLISGTHHVVQPWLLGLCCLSVFRGRGLKHIFTHPFALAVGAMSYTIYLYHYLVVLGVGRAVQNIIGRDASLGSLGLHCAVIPGTTFLISVLLFRFFERPFMDQHWYPRLWDRLSRRESNAAAST